MGLNSIRNRVKKAQVNTRTGKDLDLVAEAIEKGKYYDDLTEDEKNAYCDYYGMERSGFEEGKRLLMGSLHFTVKRKEKPLSKEEKQEVIAYLNSLRDQYNSPEEKAKREEEYRETLRIGALRKAAYLKGEDMEQYPLPWEREVSKK